MKKINKKTTSIIAIAICLIIILILTFVLGDKRINIESPKVNELYKYLGEVDIYHCGGLITYQDQNISLNNINKENALCMAYYKQKTENIAKDSIKSTGKNAYDISICKIGDVTLAANDEGNCEYEKFSKTELNKAYKEIYGKDIEEYFKFYINNKEACFLEGEEYYCGTAETLTFSLTPSAKIYRLINKAIKKLNGDIVIYDYYLKASDSTCYTTKNEEIAECKKALQNIDEIDVKFLKKYGTLYKHTFKLDSNNNHYWLSTELA